MLQFELEGRVVLDLFAGSGQMGLEALSRGARSAYLVDSGKRAIEVIKKNIQKTRLEGANAICSDSLSFLRRCAEKEKFDIVFLDPPYAQKMYKPAREAMLKFSILKPTSLIICESGEDAVFDGDAELAYKFAIEKQTKYSKTFITIFRPII
jgi:16S rRNA (guanine(966)-N(2))-methyltransferase RsmD